MREILFRGKVKYNGLHLFAGDWVEGSLIIKATGQYFIYVIELDEFGNVLREFEVEIDPETVGQFTGLCDKNGKKIFEGDILKHPNSKGVLIVVFDLGCFMLQYVDNYLKKNSVYVSIGHSEFCKIIGNIYDNPELVK